MSSSDSDSDSSTSSSNSSSLTVTSGSDTSSKAIAGEAVDVSAVLGESQSGDSATHPQLSSTEVRRQYSKLIETCQGLEEREGFEGNLQEVMTSNIIEASELFKKMAHGAVKPQGQPRTFVGYTGGGPGDMYMAFLHTRMCSGMIRYKTESIGSSTSGFKVEDFLNSLKTKSVGDSGEYSPKLAARNVAIDSAASSKTLPLLVAVVGTFDRDAISVPKEKKQRAPITRNKFDDTSGTQHEEVTIGDKGKLVREKNAPEAVAQQLNKILRHHSKNQGQPANLFEFVLDPSSLNKSIEYLFYVGFLVHDGYAALTREADTRIKDLALQLRPEKPLDKKEQQQQQKQQVNRKNTRNQFILSFSPRLYKKLCEIAQGTPIISTYKDFTEWGED